jgi:hypothetical protein
MVVDSAPPIDIDIATPAIHIDIASSAIDIGIDIDNASPTIIGIAMPTIIDATTPTTMVDITGSTIVDTASPSIVNSTSALAIDSPATATIDPVSSLTGMVSARTGGFNMAFGLFNFHVDTNGGTELISISESPHPRRIQARHRLSGAIP